MENFRDGEYKQYQVVSWYLKINNLRLLKYLPFLFPIFLTNNKVFAEGVDGVSLSGGSGVCSIKPIRVGLQKHFNMHWCRSETDQWPITGYWEFAFYHLKGKAGQKPGSHHKLNAITFAPVFRFQHIRDCISPYLELGIGLSLFSQKEIGGRDLGMHFQFEDRCSVGVRFGYDQQYDIAYRVVHFSNAYLGPCNHGLNIHFLTLGYWFN